MEFLWSNMLLFLLAIPLFIAVYVLIQRRRRRYAVRYSSLLFVKKAMGRGPGIRRHIPPALFLTGIAILTIALARPVAIIMLPSQQGTVILTMDVSGSMQADDMKPNRLSAAKAAAIAFIEREPAGVRIGVVSFSDVAAIVQAPTTDRIEAIAAINRLTPQRATAIGRGLLTSLDAIFEGGQEEVAVRPGRFQFLITPTPAPSPTPVPRGQYEPAIIVLLSDGENNQFPPPLDIVKQVSDRGIRVFTVGVGSPDGTVVRSQGRSMRTRLDEATLKKIADETDGVYFNAATEKDLRAIYESLATRLVMRAEKTELTAILTGIGVLVLLAGGFLSLWWFNRLP